MSVLTDTQRELFAEQGFLHLPGFLDEERAAELLRWTEELQEWPETPGKWMKYFETVKGERQLCRVENFLPYHNGFRHLLLESDLNLILAELMGETATLYKEKLNFKLPGGSGFGAHQDAPAFTTFGQTYHITMMLSIDATTEENGCLEMVPGRYGEDTLEQSAGGTLAEALIDSYTWEPLETKPGDVVLFHSYIPHRSAENRTLSPRRAMYVTYNRASEGDRRDDYYAHKREHFPPECERIEGRDYSAAEALYNLGNPINK
jgi:hypothetical protein